MALSQIASRRVMRRASSFEWRRGRLEVIMLGMDQGARASTAVSEAGGGVRGIVRTLEMCRREALTEHGIRLGDLLASLGSGGFCFVCILLAAPFIQPISLGPFTMASGVTFMLVGWQMMKGRERLVLPEKAQGLMIRGKGWSSVLDWCTKGLGWLSNHTRPRWSSWVQGAPGRRNIGVLVLIGGFLLFLPCANLPFNNTLPALMILFAALALLEQDGMLAAVSVFWGLMTVVYFALTGLVAFWAASGLWRWLTKS